MPTQQQLDDVYMQTAMLHAGLSKAKRKPSSCCCVGILFNPFFSCISYNLHPKTPDNTLTSLARLCKFWSAFAVKTLYENTVYFFGFTLQQSFQFSVLPYLIGGLSYKFCMKLHQRVASEVIISPCSDNPSSLIKGCAEDCVAFTTQDISLISPTNFANIFQGV